MGFSALGYVWAIQAPDPLSKLALLVFSEGCNEAGEGPFNVEKTAEMCGVDGDELFVAFGRLISAGLLEPIPETFEFRLVGFVPAKRTTYIKRKMSPKLRREILDRDGWKCVRCGAEEGLTVDHITPERRNGADDHANLQTLCMPCNRRKGFKAHG